MIVGAQHVKFLKEESPPTGSEDAQGPPFPRAFMAPVDVELTRRTNHAFVL